MFLSLFVLNNGEAIANCNVGFGQVVGKSLLVHLMVAASSDVELLAQSANVGATINNDGSSAILFVILD